MNITVIGRGNVGGGLGSLWEKAGHMVTALGREGGDAADSDRCFLPCRPTPSPMRRARSVLLPLRGAR